MDGKSLARERIKAVRPVARFLGIFGRSVNPGVCCSTN
jgi:hypothetical protein